MVWTGLHLRGPARWHRGTDPPAGLGSMLRLPLLSFCGGILQRRGGSSATRRRPDRHRALLGSRPDGRLASLQIRCGSAESGARLDLVAVAAAVFSA
jgi:hypothetical protein